LTAHPSDLLNNAAAAGDAYAPREEAGTWSTAHSLKTKQSGAAACLDRLSGDADG